MHSSSFAVLRFRPLALSVLLLLAACAGERPSATSGKLGAGGVYKVGKPYQIGGNWYYPKEDYSYDETGIASWYGADFHGQKTANGEIYNKNELTAAHKTLPMPSLARVTNLENGRSLVVRINDRGPFSGARIIDVTQRVAQLLGFEAQGTAKVRVQVLADESKAIADAMRHYGSPSPMATSTEVASAGAAPVTPVTVQQLEPATPAEVKQAMATIKPVAEVRQLPVSGPNQIYIQAGAFTNPDNAQRLKQQLASVGKVSVADVLLKGVQYYRVRLGPVADVAKADALLKRVTQSGVANARIVVD